MSALVSDDVRFKDANNVALKFLAGSAVGLIVVVLVGLIMSLQYTSIGAGFSVLFIQLRGLHLQAIIFAWLRRQELEPLAFADD